MDEHRMTGRQQGKSVLADLLRKVQEQGIRVVETVGDALKGRHPDPHRRLAEDMEKLGRARMHTPAAPWAKLRKVEDVKLRQKARRLRRRKAREASGKDHNGHTITPRKAKGIR